MNIPRRLVYTVALLCSVGCASKPNNPPPTALSPPNAATAATAPAPTTAPAAQTPATLPEPAFDPSRVTPGEVHALSPEHLKAWVKYMKKRDAE